MYDVIGKKYNIYFGGSYKEHWSKDYTLWVEYSDRLSVVAQFKDGAWNAAGGDEKICTLLNSENCPLLLKEYFEAASLAYFSAQSCLEKGLALNMLYEVFESNSNPLEGAELLRLLMDDCGFSVNEAYSVVARCCDDMMATNVDVQALSKIQPRTANILSLIRSYWINTLVVHYDSKKEEYRSPFGAVECGECVRLSFRLLSGKINRAYLCVNGDNVHVQLPMERCVERKNIYYVNYASPETACALWYNFKIETNDGTWWLCPDKGGSIGKLYGNDVGGFRLTVALNNFSTPDWTHKSVMYQIFPDRFAFSEDDTAQKGIEYHKALGQTPELHKSIEEDVRWQAREFEDSYSPDDFYGGTLKGIEGKLPYLKDLGINCIYLNPICESRSNHRYDTSDYTRPDPILGTVEDFEHLCSCAETQGIRIIIDGVFSHTGADSKYFNRYDNYPNQGACQGEKSDYYSWYDFKKFPDEYRCWWGFKDLPEVDEHNPQWQKEIITGDNSVVKTWIRRGASGWRIDVADELPDDVLALIRSAAKEEKKDAFVLGEVWEDAVIKESYGGRRNYALGYSLDSVMNYPLRTAELDFIHDRINAWNLRDFLLAQKMNYPKSLYYSLMNLLGSHDTERIRSALATDVNIRSLSREDQLKIDFSDKMMEKAIELEKLCALIQFSLPGMPSIYCGDEQGMDGVCDPFNRRPFKKGNDELHDFYRSLSNFRKETPAMMSGYVDFMAENSDIIMILRYIKDKKDAFGECYENGAFLTVINKGDKTYDFRADCSAAGLKNYYGQIMPCCGKIIDLYTGLIVL